MRAEMSETDDLIDFRAVERLQQALAAERSAESGWRRCTTPWQ
jgi:hypothetical protein